jgi:hypothetical protein
VYALWLKSLVPQQLIGTGGEMKVEISSEGSFGAIRKHDIHTGIDIYYPEGTIIRAIEEGVVINIVDFTGSKADSPWWNDTKAVMVHGESGVILYGEIESKCFIGQRLLKDEIVGKVLTVLKNNKGKPMSMLHLELYKWGTVEPVWWKLGESKPDCLLDPTFLLEKF